MATKKKISKKNVEKKLNTSKNKELYWIFGVMIFAIVALLLIPVISKQLNKFSYEGLTFTKEKFGKIPIFHYYYYTMISNAQHQYNIYLRIDPRINNVTVEGEIEYPTSKSNVYVSLNSTGFLMCENVLREMHTIADFLNGNGFSVKAANTDRNFSKENNITYLTCDSRILDGMGIVITPGNETKIVRSSDNCYTITVNNCEMLDAIEKFEVQSIIDGKKRANV